MWRKGNPHALLVGMQTGAATVESSISILKKLKIELPYIPKALPHFGIYPKDPKTPIQKTYIYTPIFISALFTVAKIWTEPKCPSVDEWIKKLWYVYRVEYYTTLKKRKLLHFCVTA